MVKRLLIAADVDPQLAALARQDGRFDVRVHPVRTEDELAAAVGDAEILVTRAYNKVSRRVIEAGRNLELIAQATSGVDNIDAHAARDRGISLINLPGENANAVAELVIGYMLALTRTIPFYSAEVAAGRWPRQDCATRHEMSYFSVGIVGLGQVGRRVARLAAAFGMDVAAYDPYIADHDFAERGARRVDSLDELVNSSRILTLHVPLSPETRQLMNGERIASMPAGAILISAARGEIINQSAALQALRSGALGGLALDVFDPEPPEGPFEPHPALILTPHVAGCTHECRGALAATLFRKIGEFYARRG